MSSAPPRIADDRPQFADEVGKVFIECASCGAIKTLTDDESTSDREAATLAILAGWAVAGRERKYTRCGRCRQEGRRDAHFLKTDPRYGHFSQRNPLLRPQCSQ